VTLVRDGGRVLGFDESGTRVSATIIPPKQAITPADDAPVFAANGRWLAFSDGAYSKEVGWLAPDATPVTLGGGALINHDHVWISRMNNTYVEVTPAGEIACGDGPKGGVAGHGVLTSEGAWGRHGYLTAYETIAQLYDTKLVKRIELPLPPSDAAYGRRLLSDPSGTTLYLGYPSGEIHVWSASIAPP